MGFFPRKELLNSLPYLNSVTRPKFVYSDAITPFLPVKKRVRFKPDLL